MSSIDPGDYKNLLMKVLNQAIEDYIKLLHPRYRKKKYLKEAWQDAVDMFFDSDYAMVHIKNDDGDDMSLQDLLETILGTDDFSIEELQDHIIENALKYWEEKKISTVQIPDSVVVNGHVYYVVHTDDTGFVANYSNNTIKLNKTNESNNEETFVNALFEIAVKYEGLEDKLSIEDTRKLSRTWFSILRLNSCFVGDS